MFGYLSQPQRGWGHCRAYRDRSPDETRLSESLVAEKRQRPMKATTYIWHCLRKVPFVAKTLKTEARFQRCDVSRHKLWFLNEQTSILPLYLSILCDIGVHGAARPLSVGRQQHQHLSVVSVFVWQRRRTHWSQRWTIRLERRKQNVTNITKYKT